MTSNDATTAPTRTPRHSVLSIVRLPIVHDRVASGRATLYSYVINQRPSPAFDGPVAVAVVENFEGHDTMTNIIDTPQTEEALVLDMELEVVFEKQTEEISLPLFRPTDGGTA